MFSPELLGVKSFVRLPLLPAAAATVPLEAVRQVDRDRVFHDVDHLGVDNLYEVVSDFLTQETGH